MTNFINDFANGIKLFHVGISNLPSEITFINETSNGFQIACEGGVKFTVSADKIFYFSNIY